MNKSVEDKMKEILLSKGIDISNCSSDNGEQDNIPKEPTPRANALRDIFYNTLATADMEFPYWYNRKWKELDGEITIVRRAKALKEAFSRVTPNIIPGEKLVMQKTRNYRGSFPMPWLSESFFVAQGDEISREASKSVGSAADELSHVGQGGGNVTKSFGEIVSIAGKFGMRKEEIPALLKVAREWVGKSVEDVSLRYEKMVPEYETKEKIMRSLVCMFDSGYTIPQGREVVNYYYPLQYGFDKLKEIAKECIDKVAGNADGDGLIGMDRLYFYEAVIIVIEGLQQWILNYANHARLLEGRSSSDQEKKEYRDIAECLESIAHNQPQNFREALQLSYILHIAVLNEDVISGLSIGKLGQILYPWYEQDIASGKITKEEVLELMELYRIKITCIDVFASAGVNGGVLSGNTFNNLSLGGLTRQNQSAANELEMIILEAGITCRTPQPTLTVMYDEKLPEEFLIKAAECCKTGTGYPAWVNNRNAMDFMINQYAEEGMTIEEARSVAIGGCLEISPCCWKVLTLNGKSYEIPGGAGQPTSVGVHFIANPKVLELVLTNGKDYRTGMQVYPPHNRKLETFEELIETFEQYYEDTIKILAKTNNIEHDIWRKQNMAVINSFLKPDSLDKGHHIGNMGYRYNGTFNVETCGTITMINSLAALKSLVYDSKEYTLNEMIDGILNNFGYKQASETGNYSLAEQVKVDGVDKYDRIYGDCLKAPKYGNNDFYVDSILKDYEEWLAEACSKVESLYGKKMYPCQISVSTHGPQGAATLATTDGRLGGTTYSDGSVSAYPGTDRNGLYALFESANIWDHTTSQNSQMNLKVHPAALKGIQGTKKLLDLTRAYMRRGGTHVQYNIIDSTILKTAQKSPDQYRDLLVRVAGFTQYWCELGKPIQDEVISRTQHEGV
ncbi:4-hydroxyphenylacetate decarboxylase large subunit [Clostridium sp. A1-XYC3]|uniref:4-hydroxyphenylacetate decarboxylase large subunit n=1 Tax=Clostridium tanneri TaxID=3037988 RepID=A0ABU4JNR8_9CLOT|nr:4-hydroxyphenylacetate decarboxylase large subunit [Clostridium sp. A1-XYC3]MDW8799750.1 4-hydroxyphenylacetate decarboxylase large subunit [Clostridium sp. A1-XYC3]